MAPGVPDRSRFLSNFLSNFLWLSELVLLALSLSSSLTPFASATVTVGRSRPFALTNTWESQRIGADGGRRRGSAEEIHDDEQATFAAYSPTRSEDDPRFGVCDEIAVIFRNACDPNGCI